MTHPTRYEIEILAPGTGGKTLCDRYTTGVRYACDHTAERILVKLDDGRDDKDRPVISASYGGGMRAVVRPVTS